MSELDDILEGLKQTYDATYHVRQDVDCSIRCSFVVVLNVQMRLQNREIRSYPYKGMLCICAESTDKDVIESCGKIPIYKGTPR